MNPTEQMAAQARAAANCLADLPTATKNACLSAIADQLVARQDEILAANARDMSAAEAAGLGTAKLKRLKLTEAGVAQMAEGLRQVADLPDPIGQVTRESTVPSGLQVRKVRCPLGVIMMIYESRPNVTIDAFALCFKAGNACILKGGREAVHSNEALTAIVQAVLSEHDVTPHALTLLTTSDREEIKALLKLEKYIDLVIPRGGTTLIEFVHEHSRIPTVQHFHGVCHMFVDASADLNKAIDLCATAKTSAPATCNAVECILVHQQIAAEFVPQLVSRYHFDSVEVRGDDQVCELAPGAKPATKADWGHEYLDLIVAVKVVPDLDAAIAHIAEYGSHHTDAILTTDAVSQSKFFAQVQSSCTLVNASTRFNDGFQLGLGAEIGISTCKIHAFGPMGLEELTAQRYVVHGDWHAR
jgi:glutamate-5-semialdehyde dehydrogenase